MKPVIVEVSADEKQASKSHFQSKDRRDGLAVVHATSGTHGQVTAVQVPEHMH